MPDISDISDLWWLKRSSQNVGQEWLAGMKLGADIRQQQTENALRKEQLRIEDEKMKAAAALAMSKMVTEAQQAKGYAALGSHLADVSQRNAWADPKSESTFWSIAQNYPAVFDKDQLDKIFSNTFGKHQEFKLKQDEAEAKIKDRSFKPENADELGLIQIEPGKWQQPHGTETFETYTDEAGHQQMRMIRGGKAGANPSVPTTAMTTKIQEGLLGAEKAIELGANAFKALTPASVGVAGQVNKVLVNEGLAQIFPGMSRNDVTEARTLLGNFNEKAVQALTAGGDKRVSDRDMQRFREILPKMTAGESLESAKQKIQTFMGEVRREARVNAKTLNRPVPQWAMSREELLDAVKTGRMTIEQAESAIEKYLISP